MSWQRVSSARGKARLWSDIAAIVRFLDGCGELQALNLGS